MCVLTHAAQIGSYRVTLMTTIHGVVDDKDCICNYIPNNEYLDLTNDKIKCLPILSNGVIRIFW